VVAGGLFGSQIPFENVAPTFVYVAFWVGLALASAVVGDVFRAFNPWLAVGRLAERLRRRPPAPYPDRLGFWPAVVGLAAFAWLELCSPSGDDPSVLAAARSPTPRRSRWACGVGGASHGRDGAMRSASTSA
jgi:hypothetical protein